MKIGVDCSRLDINNMTGTQNYLMNVLRNLSIEDRENKYLLYFREPHSNLENFFINLSNRNPNWSYKVVRFPMFWTQLGLCLHSYLDSLDRLFCTWQTIPYLKNPKTKVVVVIHDFLYKKRHFYTTYLSILIAKKVIFVSHETQKECQKRLLLRGWANSKSFVIGEGVDGDVFKVRSEEDVQKVKNRFGISYKYFLVVGAINKRKNIIKILKAFYKVYSNNTDLNTRLVLVGKYGDNVDEEKALIEKLKTLNLVTHIDNINNYDLSCIYNGAESLIYAPKSEGFGLPVLEAFSCGCRVICSDISVLKEIGSDMPIYVNQNSEEDIEKAIIVISNTLKEKELVDRLIAHSRKFSWKSVAKDILSVLII